MRKPTPVQERLAHAAERYVNAGLSIVPVDIQKKSIGDWKRYQTECMSVWDIQRAIYWDGAAGLGLVCGTVRGGVEVIDFDVLPCEYQQLTRSQDTTLFLEWWSSIPATLCSKLVIELTQSCGCHVLYRYTSPSGAYDGSLKLAMIPSPKILPPPATREFKTAIETRGEGGYVVVYPSIGEKGWYSLVQGDIADMPVLSFDERNILINAARKLNQMPDTQVSRLECKPANGVERPRASVTGTQQSVIDQFNARHDPFDILIEHSYERRTGRRLARPGGKSDSVQLLDNNGKLVSYHHSTSDALCDGYAHDAFDLFCQLELGGDVTAAVAVAAKQLGMAHQDNYPPPVWAKGYLSCPYHHRSLKGEQNGGGLYCPKRDSNSPWTHNGYCGYRWLGSSDDPRIRDVTSGEQK